MPGPRAVGDLQPFVTVFAQMALTPITVAIEHEFDASVLPAGMHLQLDLAGLMRGSFSASVAALAALVGAGVISTNDAREELGWSPRPDGDGLRVNGSPNWPADFTGGDHLGPSPGPRGNGVAEPGTHQNSGRMNGQAVMQ